MRKRTFSKNRIAPVDITVIDCDVQVYGRPKIGAKRVELVSHHGVEIGCAKQIERYLRTIFGNNNNNIFRNSNDTNKVDNVSKHMSVQMRSMRVSMYTTSSYCHHNHTYIVRSELPSRMWALC